MEEISNENPDFWLLLKYQKIWHPGRTCSVTALARGCERGLALGGCVPWREAVPAGPPRPPRASWSVMPQGDPCAFELNNLEFAD